MTTQDTRSTSGTPDPDRTRPLPSGADSPPAPASPAQIPTRIGRYTILRILGEGGMGTVYEAQQESPKRTVALKVIRAGYLSPQLLRRFEHESQVLGRLQHPGIAQVYEAGVARGGTALQSGDPPIPFFAMEFIRGVPLTDYANQKHLTTRARLDLIARICDAVYHAHQKGVIHRDLKPANILVDESGQPKILDFGVARATDSDIQQTTIQTDIGQLIGTVPYMSPEQVSGNPDDLDTRSDVYALGVIAYELLAGRLPHDLKKKMIHEAARIIKEEEPTRLSSINKTLRGDIETIVAKALEKDKSRRYQSAESLGSDIRRYLKDEPITARPASTWYQAAKFSKRNKALVGGALATFLVLVGGLATTLWQVRIADRERDGARRAAAESHVARVRAEQVAELLTETLGGAGPSVARGRDSTILREIMDSTASALSDKLKGQPDVEAEMRAVLGATYRDIGASEQGEKSLTRSAELWRSIGETGRPGLADALENLAHLHLLRKDARSADPLLKEAYAIRVELTGERDRRVAINLDYQANVLRLLGDSRGAVALFGQSLDMKKDLCSPGDREIETSINNLGDTLNYLHEYNAALPYAREAVESARRRVQGPHVDLAANLNNLATALRGTGKFDEAEARAREALEMHRVLLGPDDLNVAFDMNNLASLYEERKDFENSEREYLECLRVLRTKVGERHAYVGALHSNLGLMFVKKGDFGRAESHLREALDIQQETAGGEHPETGQVMINLAEALRHQGRYAEAAGLLRKALDISSTKEGASSVRAISSSIVLAAVLSKQASDPPSAGASPAALLQQAEDLARGALELCSPASGEVTGPRVTWRKSAIETLIAVFQARETLEPGEGYDAKAAEWKARLEALTPPAAQPTAEKK